MGEPIISRHDFIFKIVPTFLGGVLLAACAPKGEVLLPRTLFNSQAVIYKGRVTSLNELPSRVKKHLNKIDGQINGLYGLASQGLRPGNPEGYLGDSFPLDFLPDKDRETIIVDETEDGRLVSQVFFGREHPTEIVAGINITPFINGKAFFEKSLVVVAEGYENSPIWFDNVDSKDGKNKIRVNTKKGTVFQIHTEQPKIADRWIKQEQTEVIINSLDLFNGENRFKPVETVFSQKYIKIILGFISKIKEAVSSTDNRPEAVIEMTNSYFDYLYPRIFLGTLSDQEIANALLDFNSYYNLGNQLLDWQNQLIMALKGVNSDIPTDLETSMTLAQTLRTNFDLINNQPTLEGLGAIIDQNLENVALTVPFINKPQEPLDEMALETILDQEIALPMQTPELYFIKVKKNSLTGEPYFNWYLMGRYQGLEKGVDETNLSGQKEGFAPGEFYFTYGKVSEKLVKSLSSYQTVVDGFPNEVLTKDSNLNQPLLGGEIDLTDENSVRMINRDNIRFFWDPSQNRLFPGLFDRFDSNQIVLLHLQNFWANNFDAEKIFDNRKFPFMEANPKAIKDVTEQVRDLISRGYTTASKFGLRESAFSAGITISMNEYINYEDLRIIIEDLRFGKEGLFIGQDSTFQARIIDNAFLVYTQDARGKNTNIEHFINGVAIESEILPVNHDIMLRFSSIEKIVNSEGEKKYYGIIAVNSEDKNDFYAVSMDSVFNVGSDSDFKVFVEVALKIAPWLAAAYGGYRLYKVPLVGKTLDFVGKGIGSLILKIMGK